MRLHSRCRGGVSCLLRLRRSDSAPRRDATALGNSRASLGRRCRRPSGARWQGGSSRPVAPSVVRRGRTARAVRPTGRRGRCVADGHGLQGDSRVDRREDREADRGLGEPAGATVPKRALQLVDALPEQAVLLACLGARQGRALGCRHGGEVGCPRGLRGGQLRPRRGRRDREFHPEHSDHRRDHPDRSQLADRGHLAARRLARPRTDPDRDQAREADVRRRRDPETGRPSDRRRRRRSCLTSTRRKRSTSGSAT